MQSIDPNRAAFFLVIFAAFVLGLALANVSAADWVPYVLLGLGCLSVGLLLTLLFAKNAGISFSWPALLAMGLVLTLLFTGIFKRLFADDIPEEVSAVVEALQDHQAEEGSYPESLAELPLDDIPNTVRYVPRQRGLNFTLNYRPEEGTAQTYRSDVGEWNVSD